MSMRKIIKNIYGVSPSVEDADDAQGITLQELYDILIDMYGPQQWWPGDSPFEVCVGAILTQQTKWQNAAKAIENLKDRALLEPSAIAKAEPSEIENLVRSSGFFRQKAARLQGFCRHIVDEWNGSVEVLLEQPLEKARSELLALKGIGPETADSMLLYAGEHPVFVVDAYAVRIINRMGLFNGRDYHDVQRFFENGLSSDAAMFNEYHALLVEHGKNICRTRPRCSDCSITNFCKAAKDL